MFCHQCSMSAEGGCGSTGAAAGNCGKLATLARLQDTIVFGLKGLAVYREHLNKLDPTGTKAIDDVISESLYFALTNVNFTFEEHTAQLMKIGAAGVEVMERLGEAHHEDFGVPTPVEVSQNRAEGKAILVSGHSLHFLKELLEATEGRGINVYTHSEMLPAHGYPELRKFEHLRGNIGGSWTDQRILFKKWQGTIVVNTNCIVPTTPKCEYLDRLFAWNIVSVPGVRKIKVDGSFDELIEKTLECPEVSGFDAETTLKTGHNFKTVLGMAGEILDAVKSGKIRKFFVVGGCDSPGKDGEYYRDLVKLLPPETVILTVGCGKFRFNDLNFGNVPGTEIPRYLDLGQCNDSYGAVQIAMALGKALDTKVNDLPIAIVLSWTLQDAVLILLSLFHLGIKNVYLGPRPPQFANEEIVDFFQKNFKLKFTGTAEEDLREIMKR